MKDSSFAFLLWFLLALNVWFGTWHGDSVQTVNLGVGLTICAFLLFLHYDTIERR